MRVTRLASRFLFLLIALTACGKEPSTNKVAMGEALYKGRGCASCHSVDGSSRIGPTWKGLYGQQVKLTNGTTVTADDAYLKESINAPSAKTVAGFRMGLMETVIKPGTLSEQEVQVLIAYIKSLR